jgi:hypothetical protein
VLFTQPQPLQRTSSPKRVRFTLPQVGHFSVRALVDGFASVDFVT